MVERQSYWTLHDAYHNLVPANASKGTWPLSPVDKQFEYIRARYVWLDLIRFVCLGVFR